jgi:diguanylate cyclase (GGDEF)-like protein
VAFVGVLTPDGVLIEANQTALEAANLQLEDVLGKPFEETYWWAHSPAVQQQLRGAIQQAASGERIRYDVEVRLAERERITIDFSLVPLFDSEGKVEYLIPSGVNITDRKIQEKQLNASREWLSDANRMLEMQVHLVHEQAAELESQKAALEATNQKLEEANALLEALSITDGLTGLLNHRAFQEHLGKEWERSLRSGQPFSVVLMDVDKFKTYNDAFGHPEGDEVLKKVAFLLKETARTVDFVCRYGGEEFVILLPNTDVQGSMVAAERFRQVIEEHPWVLRPITGSFGVATFQNDYATAQAMVEAADKALYKSKNCGRNQVTHAALEIPLSTVPTSFQDCPHI